LPGIDAADAIQLLTDEEYNDKRTFCGMSCPETPEAISKLPECDIVVI